MTAGEYLSYPLRGLNKTRFCCIMKLANLKRLNNRIPKPLARHL